MQDNPQPKNLNKIFKRFFGSFLIVTLIFWIIMITVFDATNKIPSYVLFPFLLVIIITALHLFVSSYDKEIFARKLLAIDIMVLCIPFFFMGVPFPAILIPYALEIAGLVLLFRK